MDLHPFRSEGVDPSNTTLQLHAMKCDRTSRGELKAQKRTNQTAAGSVDRRDTTKWIKFQWNDRTTTISDCDTKHFMYLIYSALQSVERRQRRKNAKYIKMGYPHRVIEPLDKEAVITSLLDVALNGDDADRPNRNRLNGRCFMSMSSRAFTNEVLSGCGGVHCTLGWAIKIYAKLEEKARCIGSIRGEVAIPNLKYQDFE